MLLLGPRRGSCADKSGGVVLWLVLGWAWGPGCIWMSLWPPCDRPRSWPHERSRPSGPSHPASVLPPHSAAPGLTSAPVLLALPIQHLSSPHTLQLLASRALPSLPSGLSLCFHCLAPMDTPTCWDTFVSLPAASLGPLSSLAPLVRLVTFPLPTMRSPALGTFEVLGVLRSAPSGWPHLPGSLSYCLCDRDLYRVTCLTFFLPPSCHLPWIILIHFKVDEPILELLSSP